MSVTLNFSASVEHQLRDDAARSGMSLEQYIIHVITSRLAEVGLLDVDELGEDDLLQRVQLDIQPRELDEYYRLVDLRKAERLTGEEYDLLIALTNWIEIAHAERMKYVVALAKLQGVSFEQIMVNLGIQKKIE